MVEIDSRWKVQLRVCSSRQPRDHSEGAGFCIVYAGIVRMKYVRCKRKENTVRPDVCVTMSPLNTTHQKSKSSSD